MTRPSPARVVKVAEMIVSLQSPHLQCEIWDEDKGQYEEVSGRDLIALARFALAHAKKQTGRKP